MGILPMNRSPRGWAEMKPEAVCAGSEAQIFHCIRDAQADIATLVGEVRRLETLLTARPSPCLACANHLGGNDGCELHHITTSLCAADGWKFFASAVSDNRAAPGADAKEE